MDRSEQHEQIKFKFYSELFEQDMEESLWAFVLDKSNGLFQIDSIPFYVPLIASDDIVFAEYEAEEESYVYRKTVGYSGNSTIQVVLSDDATTPIDDVREVFSQLGCMSEQVNDSYFVFEVPAAVNYLEVRRQLDKLEAAEEIEYAEPSLSEVHRLQTSN